MVALIPTDVLAKTSWANLGTKKVSSGLVSSRKGFESNIAVSSTGKVYAAYQDNGERAKVKVFDGARWSDLADGNYPEGAISSGKGGNPNIAARGNDIYVAFMDYDNNTRAKVMKHNGSAWSEVADASHPNGYLTTLRGHEPELAFDRSGQYLYAIFSDQAYSDRIRVLRWSQAGGWQPVADADNSDGFITSGTAYEGTIIASKKDDSMYVAFEDTSHSNQIRLKKWNGTQWTDLSDGQHPSGYISSYDGYSPSVDVDSQDNLYVVYTSHNDNKTSKYAIGNLKRKEARTYIHKWNGSSWLTVGNGTVTNSKNIESCITVDARDNLYVAFSEHKKNVRMEGKRQTFWRVKVKIYNGQKWIVAKQKRDPYISQGKGKGDPSIVAFQNTVYTIFTDDAKNNRVRVKRLIYN